ncbi:MAG: serine/threonine-protein phosphatase, partial [Gammaproteobacteria bacterium]|nr:serine/threonine-protein phosphatase [Gammaproteobacteria bacterium]
TWTHLGDSRLYHFREDNLQIRTKDHSIVQMLVDMGRIREEDMATHRDQGRLLKGLGGDEPPELEFHHSLALAGDAFILCSDGLWERLSAKEMQQHLQPFGLKKKAKNLVELAARRGGKYGDNVAAAAAYRVR